MERYDVHAARGEWAATIALREWVRPNNRGNELHGGEILINSDWGGPYAYSWGNMGSPLKQFLCQISRDYIITKLTNGNDTEFDFDASLAAVKKEILRMRKERELSHFQARMAMDDIPSEDEGQDQFIRRLWDMEAFRNGDPPTEFVKERECPQITGFYKNVWIPFTDHLRTELAS
ncbi:MAG TPA: hypothetical protein VF534_01335 [Paraburkholderia sp.]